MSYDPKIDRAARELAARITSMVTHLETIEQWAPVVIDQCRGIGGDVWIVYDDAGGNAHSWTKPQFHKVRQVRNSPHWGKLLFDAINERKKK